MTDKPQSNLFVRLLRAIWRGLDGVRKLTHLFLMLLVLGAFLGGALSGSVPSIPGSAMLSIAPKGALVEELVGSAFDRAVAELVESAAPQTLIRDVVDALEYAATDKRIKGVYLDLSAFGGGSIAKLAIVADAIRDFRESGKPVIASADYYSQASYYLAAHADEVYMHPDGIVFMQGYGLYRPYFSDAIEKLKLDWNVFRVGTHKSFVEPYTRMNMSQESREATGRVVRQLWDLYTLDVEAARGLDEGALRAMVDNFAALAMDFEGDLAAAAVAHDLIDELKNRQAIRDRLIEVAGFDDEVEDSFSSVSQAEYLRERRLLDTASEEQNVAIVVAAGEILDGMQSPGQIGGDSTAGLLRQALHDDAVKAVVLRVDSPGGSAFASEVISNAVVALQEAGKPVMVSMSGVAASGGYWIAAKADRIFAAASTITGSIGIFGMFPTYQRTAAYLGVNVDGVAATPWVDALRSDRKMSDRAKQVFQQVINHGYDDFLQHVALGRGMSVEAADAIGQGRIWTGTDALHHGLVDQLGDLDDAVAAAAEAAGLEADSYGSRYVTTPLSPTEQMVIDLLGSVKSLGLNPGVFVSEPRLIERLALRFEAMLDPLRRFNDPRGVYAHCFCVIE